ncbi:hypothetical protein [Streptomyces asoensis]|uniref:Transposase n=1 Tax=Streptomyces asoensis TaxID=249586 RepID=A0ABQ3S755_9ACTN|nr:hypothetical protein [Streptomyces asoensis]GGQ78145.1 hypothetical protein GCM10010496_47310 [Streptomyces asoensis]GHI63782.1 hypothetical protein Saso_54320 [Streptomyces asoensis]
MTAHTEEQPVILRAETGWARARRIRRQSTALRTCLPAVAAAPSATAGMQTGAEWNIVRGED